MNKTIIVNLGSIHLIPIAQGRCFIINGEEVAVFRPRSGGVFAMQNQCPHRKGPLSEGVIGGGKVICPLHGHKFELQSGQGKETQECVRVYKVWEEEEQIRLEWTLGTEMINPSSCVSVS